MNDPAKVQQVLTWILEGASEFAIAEAITETWPDTEARPLILSAMQSVQKSLEQPHELTQAWCIEATKFLYAKQLEVGDFAGAMKAVKQLHDLSAGRSNTPIVPRIVEHRHTHDLGVITLENFEDHKKRLSERIREVTCISEDPAGPRATGATARRATKRKTTITVDAQPVDRVNARRSRGTVQRHR